ncbi:hypothetical protein ACPF8X_33670 [Streptomyces sp. G35A]
MHKNVRRSPVTAAGVTGARALGCASASGGPVSGVAAAVRPGVDAVTGTATQVHARDVPALYPRPPRR